jgi:hypothetical protein
MTLLLLSYLSSGRQSTPRSRRGALLATLLKFHSSLPLIKRQRGRPIRKRYVKTICTTIIYLIYLFSIYPEFTLTVSADRSGNIKFIKFILLCAQRGAALMPTLNVNEAALVPAARARSVAEKPVGNLRTMAAMEAARDNFRLSRWCPPSPSTSSAPNWSSLRSTRWCAGATQVRRLVRGEYIATYYAIRRAKAGSGSHAPAAHDEIEAAVADGDDGLPSGIFDTHVPMLIFRYVRNA